MKLNQKPKQSVSATRSATRAKSCIAFALILLGLLILPSVSHAGVLQDGIALSTHKSFEGEEKDTFYGIGSEFWIKIANTNAAKATLNLSFLSDALGLTKFDILSMWQYSRTRNITSYSTSCSTVIELNLSTWQNCTSAANGSYLDYEAVPILSQKESGVYKTKDIKVDKDGAISWLKVLAKAIKGTSTKFDISLTGTYTALLDPLFNASLTNQWNDTLRCTGCLTSVTNIPYLVNSTGFDFNGSGTQYVWTRAYNINSSQFIENTGNEYQVVNVSLGARVPMDVEYGNSSDFQAVQLWNNTGWRAVFDITTRGASYTDLASNHNTSNSKGYNLSTGGYVGEYVNFTTANYGGTSDFVRVTQSAYLESGALTMCYWINLDRLGGNAEGFWMSMSGATAGDAEWVFGNGQVTGANKNLTFRVYDTAWRSIESSHTLVPKVWTHVCGKQAANGAGSEVAIYVNGTKIGNTTMSGTRQNSNQDFLFNCRDNGNQQCTPAAFDMVMVADRNVNDDEIKALYEAQRRVVHSDTSQNFSSLTLIPQPAEAQRPVTSAITKTCVSGCRGLNYANNSATINVSATVTNSTTNGTVNVVDFEYGGFNFTAKNNTQSNFYFELTVNSSFPEGNNTLRIRAATTTNASLFLNASADDWIIHDSIAPNLPTFTRTNTGCLISCSSTVNITANDTNLNTTVRLTTNHTGAAINRTDNFTSGLTISINATARPGNWTFQASTIDLAGNTFSSSLTWGVGSLNVTLGSLTAVNFSSGGSAWGEPSRLSNDSYTALTTDLNVLIEVLGELSSQTGNISVNLSTVWSNWTAITVINTSSGNPATTQVLTLTNWTSEVLSTGQQINHTLRIVSNNQTLRFSHNRLTATTYRFLIENGFSRSFTEYARFSLPNEMNFDKTSQHLRYWVCTGTVTAATYACSAFSTPIDVDSSNSGNNAVSGYNVNFFMEDNATVLSTARLQANHSDFLIEVSVISGAWQAGGGQQIQQQGGGGGGDSFPSLEEIAAIIPKETICPDGYSFNGTACTRLIARPDLFLKAFLEPRAFGLSLLHLALAGGFIFAVVKSKEAGKLLKGLKTRPKKVRI